jgi:hypothetical protein
MKGKVGEQGFSPAAHYGRGEIYRGLSSGGGLTFRALLAIFMNMVGREDLRLSR